VQAGELAALDAAFTDVDIYTTLLHYHDKIKHTLYDNAHEVANAVKQMLIFIGNHVGKKLKFNPGSRQHELSAGRFPQMAPQADEKKLKYSVPPWVASAANQTEIDELTKTLKVPTGWPDVRKIFEHKLFMKSSENMLLAGSAGAYLLRLMDIEDDYKELFIKFVHLLERYNACTSFFLHSVRFSACTSFFLPLYAFFSFACFIMHIMRLIA